MIIAQANGITLANKTSPSLFFAARRRIASKQGTWYGGSGSRMATCRIPRFCNCRAISANAASVRTDSTTAWVPGSGFGTLDSPAA